MTPNSRRDLGDGTTGVTGTGCRPIGKIENPKLLTEYRPDYPYYIAMYDSTKPDNRLLLFAKL